MDQEDKAEMAFCQVAGCSGVGLFWPWPSWGGETRGSRVSRDSEDTGKIFKLLLLDSSVENG